jgi:hypothetical protein
MVKEQKREKKKVQPGRIRSSQQTHGRLGQQTHGQVSQQTFSAGQQLQVVFLYIDNQVII